MIGQTIQHYKILEKLGEGGMGVVYKAHDTKLDRDVALKFLPQHLTSSEEDKQRFIREAKAAAALNHPNICTIHSVDEHGGNQFIVMEYIDGNTLGELQKSGKLKPEMVIDYATQIAEALSKAHDAGIIHRDIKPGNIMVNADGRIKVMDFGLAKLKGSAGEITKTGSTVGTTAYMAPEQIQGQEVDHRADIFSFGVVFFEMLTGVRPFRGEHEAALIYAIVNEEPASIQAYLPDAPETLEHFFVRALAKDPGERFSSAGEVIEALASLKETKGISEARAQSVKDIAAASAAPEQEKQQDSGSSTTISITLPGLGLGEIALGGRRLLIGAAGILLTALFAGWWFAGEGNGEEEAIETPVQELAPEAATTPSPPSDRAFVAVLPLENLSPDEENAFFTDGIHEEIISQLSAVSELGVFGRTTMRQYADTDRSLAEIGQELGAEAILEGSVRRAGDRVRITVQLIDPRTQDHLWAETYERELSPEAVFDIQADIAARITAALETELTGAERARIATAPTENLAAYDAYLKGRDQLRGGVSGGLAPAYPGVLAFAVDSAIVHLRDAVAADSAFATAHGLLSYAYALRLSVSGQDRWEEYALSALDAAEELDPDLPEVHLAHGVLFQPDSRERAERAYRRVLEDHPDHRFAQVHMASLVRMEGRRAEEINWFLSAIRQDPRNTALILEMVRSLNELQLHEAAEAWRQYGLEHDPDNRNVLIQRVWPLRDQGRLSEALEFIREVPGEFPYVEGWLLLKLDRVDEAVSLLKQAQEEVERQGQMSPTVPETFPVVAVPYGHAELLAGDGERGRSMLQETADWLQRWVEVGETHPFGLPTPIRLAQLAEAQQALGETQAARDNLRVATEELGLQHLWPLTSPIFDPVRQEPWFRDLFEQVEARVVAERERIEQMELDLYPPGMGQDEFELPNRE